MSFELRYVRYIHSLALVTLFIPRLQTFY